MKFALAGRADLARAYLSGGAELQKAVAGLLGFESLTPQVFRLEAVSRYEVRGESSVIAHGEPGSAEPSINLPFWQANSFRVFESSVRTCGRNWSPATIVTACSPRIEFYAPWNTPASPLESRLSRGSEEAPTRVRRLRARSRQGRRPVEPGRAGPQNASPAREEMGPVDPGDPRSQPEADSVLARPGADGQRSERACHHDSLQVAVLGDGSEEPRLDMPGTEPRAWKMPEPGANVIVLGDLGCLDRTSAGSCLWWLSWGLRLRANGNHALAVVPSTSTAPAELSKAWTIIRGKARGVQRTRPDQTARSCRKILTLLSFSLRVEPG